jgi:hypothetical protein
VNDIIVGIRRLRRFPQCPLHDQFHRLEPLTLLCIVPEAYAEEVVIVLLSKSLGAPLTRLEDQSRLHKGKYIEIGASEKQEKKGIFGR